LLDELPTANVLAYLRETGLSGLVYRMVRFSRPPDVGPTFLMLGHEDVITPLVLTILITIISGLTMHLVLWLIKC
jgi:hypothetical protein